MKSLKKFTSRPNDGESTLLTGSSGGVDGRKGRSETSHINIIEISPQENRPVH